MMSYQPWMSSLMSSNTSSPFAMGTSSLSDNLQNMMMFTPTNPAFNFCSTPSSDTSNYTTDTSSPIPTPKSSPVIPDAISKVPFFNFDLMSMDDQEKKKLERKRARNRQAASKCRQKKMDRIKELEDQVLHEKHRGQRLDAELVELNRALSNFRQMVERHSNTGCPNSSIRA